jgi:predicted nuclease of predicted toxin-antitoxin system
MKPLDFPLLADENIHPEIIEALAAKGKQITSVQAHGLASRSDREILRYAHSRGWAVLTHDSASTPPPPSPAGCSTPSPA